VGESLWSRDGPARLPSDPLQQKLEIAAVDPVALHDEADQGSVIREADPKIGPGVKVEVCSMRARRSGRDEPEDKATA
jgi:hypothetical protein